MRWVVLAGFVAGCYSPTYEPGSPCSVEVGCPGDLICDPLAPGGPTCVRPGQLGQPDSAIDAPIDAVPDGDPGAPNDGAPDANPDIDGDGDPNDLDNCPEVPNPNQGDEDQDDIGNECDSCPHLPEVQLDTDGDGVGDDCDPGPEQHQILAFETFDTALPATWIATPAGTWTVTSDQATGDAEGNSATTLMTEVPLDRAITIATRFTIGEMNNTTAVGRSFGVLNRSDAATSEGNACTLTSRLPPSQDHLFILSLDTNLSDADATVEQLAIGQSYVMVATELPNNELYCGTSGTPGQHDLMTAQTGQGQYVGLRLRAGAASFDYVLIIAGPIER